MAHSFFTDRNLRFGDCDMSGTAYYPAYINLLNGVIEEFFTVIGFPWHRIMWEERWGTPTVHLTCDFSKPSFFGDVLTFGLDVAKVGRSSARFEHEISCGGEKRWTGVHVIAASNIDDHTSIPWPDAVRAKLLEFVKAVE